MAKRLRSRSCWPSDFAQYGAQSFVGENRALRVVGTCRNSLGRERGLSFLADLHEHEIGLPTTSKSTLMTFLEGP